MCIAVNQQPSRLILRGPIDLAGRCLTAGVPVIAVFCRSAAGRAGVSNAGIAMQPAAGWYTSRAVFGRQKYLTRFEGLEGDVAE